MIKRFFILLFLLVGLLACVEELDIVNVTSEEEAGALVIEATLTNIVERQKVFLSRSVARLDLETDTTYFRFRPLGLGLQDSVAYEENANVRVLGSDGSIYTFTEENQGTYLSQEPFKLLSGVDYKVEIVTVTGTSYESENVYVPDVSEITNVYAERITTNLGEEGIQVYVDSEPILGNPSNFRYTYEETYKIIAPNWNEDDFLLTNYDPCALPVPTYHLEIIPRKVQNRICYNTVASNRVIQSTAIDSTNTVQGFPVRFIAKNDYVTANRYSIIVRQYVQSPEAYGFYQILKNQSENSNVFSQIQPGPLEANVKRSDGGDEMVLGYVDATSVSEQRIYLEYNDFFPGEELPPYPFPCIEESAPESHVSYCFTGLNANTCPPSTIERIDAGIINYTGLNDDNNIGICPGPYTFIAKVCGDCTLLGKNEAPDFWEE